MKDDTKKSSKKQSDDFINLASHELNTPLFSLMGNLTLIKDKRLFGNLTDEQKNVIDDVCHQCEILCNLVSNILLSQKLRYGTLELKKEHVYVESLIDEIYKLHQDTTAVHLEKKLLLPKNTEIVCDHKRLEQIFELLIRNTIDFLPKQNGHAVIGVESDGRFVKFSVTDNGTGIKCDQLENVFDDFYQVDLSARRNHFGVGLGLGICKMLTEKMGGKIWAENCNPNGCKFCFTAPVLKK